MGAGYEAVNAHKEVDKAPVYGGGLSPYDISNIKKDARTRARKSFKRTIVFLRGRARHREREREREEKKTIYTFYEGLSSDLLKS